MCMFGGQRSIRDVIKTVSITKLSLVPLPLSRLDMTVTSRRNTPFVNIRIVEQDYDANRSILFRCRALWSFFPTNVFFFCISSRHVTKAGSIHKSIRSASHVCRFCFRHGVFNKWLWVCPPLPLPWKTSAFLVQLTALVVAAAAAEGRKRPLEAEQKELTKKIQVHDDDKTNPKTTEGMVIHSYSWQLLLMMARVMKSPVLRCCRRTWVSFSSPLSLAHSSVSSLSLF